MRAGGGKNKGSDFERLVARKLSLWVSSGLRADLFARNVLSGGSFTHAMKKGSKEHGIPGDLTANHPLAFKFLTKFCIECKHYTSLGLDAFLFDTKLDKSFLGKVWTKAHKEAVNAKLRAMVIAQQNRRPPIVLIEHDVMDAILLAVPRRLRLSSYHSLFGQKLAMVPLGDMVTFSIAELFLSNMESIPHAPHC